MNISTLILWVPCPLGLNSKIQQPAEETMTMQEIPLVQLDAKRFIEEQTKMVSETVGANTAINALSGGVGSSAVTLIGHKALGAGLVTYFIDNGLMREGEPEQVVTLFESLGVRVRLVDAREEFLDALKGIKDPEEKRGAIVRTFYQQVFGRLIRETGARHLLQGTILTGMDETTAGIHPEEAFGYKILEPLAQLRKDGVRKVAEALGLPASIYNRMSFPSPALAVRIIGEATAERLALVRKATAITEECLIPAGVFQCMAILHEDRVAGMRAGKRDCGLQIEIRCWDRHDARRSFPTRLDWETLEDLSLRILDEVPGVVSVTYNIAPKPPSTMEAG
jgi:GMP synthase (glutamine-hydrolysing)